MPSNSRSIAALVGPIAIAVAATEAFNLHIFRQNSPQFVYLNGTILFASGLALLRAHAAWERSWTTLITALGWSILLLGLYRMTLPESVSSPSKVVILGSIALLGAVGACLTYKGYVRHSTGSRSVE